MLISNFGELVVDNVNLEVGTIKGNYEEEIKAVTDDVVNTFNGALENQANGEYVNWPGFWESVSSNMYNGSQDLSDETKKNIEGMLENMKPQVEQLEEVAQSYKEAGQTCSGKYKSGV